MKLIKRIAVVLFCIIFGCSCDIIIPIIPDPINPTPSSGDNTSLCTYVAPTAEESSVVNHYTNLSSGVVKLAACYTVNDEEIETSGSGFIFDRDERNDNGSIVYTYYICTSASNMFYRYITSVGENSFDISDNTKLVTEGIFEITFDDGHRYAGSLVGHYTNYDIAVFKFETKEDFLVLNFGDSDKVEVGDEITIIGSTSNGYDLINSMLKGYISGDNRLSSIGYTNTYNGVTYSDTVATYASFQLDAAVNEGMQGSPVFNSNNEVIGMVGYKIYGSSGYYESMVYAEYSSELVPILKSIQNSGTFVKPLMGVTVQDISNAILDSNNSWLNTQGIYHGAFIVSDGVSSSSPAEKAGVNSNSVIIGLINDSKEYEVKNMSSLYDILVRIDKSKSTQVKVVESNGLVRTLDIQL